MVKFKLKEIIQRDVEVVPLQYLIPGPCMFTDIARVSVVIVIIFFFFCVRCDWTFVGNVEPRSRSLIAYSTEITAANASHSASKLNISD
jgi:hypothetical protein